MLPALWNAGRKGKFLGAAVVDWSIHPESLQAGNKEYMQLDTDQISETAAAQYLLCVSTLRLISMLHLHHSNLMQV